MDGVILVSSETGFTKKYADWISEETGFAVSSPDSSAKLIPSNVNIIIFGSPIYGGELKKQKLLRRLLDEAGDTKIICFATGLYPADEALEKRLRDRFIGKNRSDAAFYYLPGGLDKEKLKPARKTELFLYRMMMNRHPDKGEAERIFLKRTGDSADYTDRGLLKPLLEDIENHKKKRK